MREDVHEHVSGTVSRFRCGMCGGPVVPNYDPMGQCEHCGACLTCVVREDVELTSVELLQHVPHVNALPC